MGKNQNSQKTKQGEGNMINDSRFSKVHYDPKFQNLQEKEKKTKIDSRFSGMFTDKRFKIVGKTDKYGRELQAKDDKKNKEMDEYYYMSDDAEEQQNEDSQELENQEGDESESPEDIVIEDQEDDDDEQDEQQGKGKGKKLEKSQNKKKENKQKNKENNNNKQKQNKQKKQKDQQVEEIEDPFKNGFTWDEVSSSEEEIEEIVEEDDKDLWEQKQEKIQYGDDTSRKIALQNYDWVHIGSKELMVLFSSFCKSVGFIKSVTVYPSQYGKEQMEKEQMNGPQGIWKQNQPTKTQQEVENYQRKKDRRPIRTIDNRIIVKEDDQQCDIDLTSLRKYEQNRLKYYYAVIECDSVKTAVHIYENCNDQEFELTGVALDLRFVPDDLAFPFEAKEICSKMPHISEVKSFTNRSLAHTNVELTWDEPNNGRFKFLQGKDLNDEDLDKIDWEQYLGDMGNDDDEGENESEEEELDSEQEEELERERLKQLAEKNKAMDWRSNFDKQKKKKERKEDMEITFMSGFGDIQANQKKRLEEENESGWEKYLRQKKEKKKLRKQVRNNDEDFFIDPEQQKQDKKAEKFKLKRERQNLELLVNEEQENKEKGFQIDVADDRFNKMYQNQEYYLDPTHKDFKKDISGKFLQEQQRRRQQKNSNKKIKLNQ